MKKTYLVIATTAAFLLGADIAAAQFVAAQGNGQRQTQGNRGNNSAEGNRRGSADGTGKQGQGTRDGSGPGAKSGERSGPQNGSGPIHTPPNQGTRRGRR